MKAPRHCETFDAGGAEVTIRTLEPSDRDLEADFARRLSPRSVYLRFHGPMRQLSDAMLDRFTQLSYPDEMALIATVASEEGERQVGVVRYIRRQDDERAEVAIVVSDEWQRRGIGRRLLLALREEAKRAGIKVLEASVLAENRGMIDLARELGFHTERNREDFRTVDLGKGIDSEAEVEVERVSGSIEEE